MFDQLIKIGNEEVPFDFCVILTLGPPVSKSLFHFLPSNVFLDLACCRHVSPFVTTTHRRIISDAWWRYRSVAFFLFLSSFTPPSVIPCILVPKLAWLRSIFVLKKHLCFLLENIFEHRRQWVFVFFILWPNLVFIWINFDVSPWRKQW